jgi:hypothetical protein
MLVLYLAFYACKPGFVYWTTAYRILNCDQRKTMRGCVYKEVLMYYITLHCASASCCIQ